MARFSDPRAIVSDLLLPCDYWVSEGAPAFAPKQAGYEDYPGNGPVLARSADILVAIKLPNTPDVQTVAIKLREPHPVPCHKVGEWWVLDAPIVMLWAQYDASKLLVNGEFAADDAEHITRVVFLEDGLRRAFAHDARGDNTIITLTYPSCILKYSKSELHIVTPTSLPNNPASQTAA